jgi:hypothetical protein
MTRDRMEKDCSGSFGAAPILRPADDEMEFCLAHGRLRRSRPHEGLQSPMIAKVLLVVVSADIAESEPTRPAPSLELRDLMTLGTMAVTVVDAIYRMLPELIDRVEIIYS